MLIKKTIFHLLLVLAPYISVYSQENTLPIFFENTDQFFENTVKNNLVDYNLILTNPSELNDLIELMGNVSLEGQSPNTIKAFWINAYNISVIKSVIQNYPIKSPLDVNGFFSTKKHLVAGEKVTLDDMEKDILIKTYKDPRFHFVLVCGAMGCPPIIPEAYFPETLDSQMDEQTKKAVNNTTFTRVLLANNKLELSEIFKWYEKDFKYTNPSVLDFVNSYRNVVLPSDISITYYTYDWSLNNSHTTEIEDIKSFSPDNEKSMIQTYTPSKLLKMGQWDLKLFNNFYSETAAIFDGDKNNIERSNFYTASFEVYTGITKNSRVNVGVLFNIKSTTLSNDSTYRNFFSPIAFRNESGISRSGVGSIAPSIRFQPFKKVSNFSIQSSVFIPLVKEETTNGIFLDKKSFVIENRLFYDYSFAKDKLQIFADLNTQLNIGAKDEGFANNSLGLPFGVFLSYFPVKWWTIYGQAQQYFLIDLGNEFSQEFTQIGVGMKFQVSKKVNIETSATKFVRGTDTGLGQTVNVGLRTLF